MSATTNTEMKYEDDLKKYLAKLFEVKSLLKPLETEEEKIKERIKKWMDLNSLDKHNVKDDDGHVWMMGKVASTRKNIKDWKLLESILKESEWALIVKESNSDTYRITCPELNIDKAE